MSNKKKISASAVSSLLMSAAMVGTTVAPAVSVLASSDDSDEIVVQNETMDESSEEAVASLLVESEDEPVAETETEPEAEPETEAKPKAKANAKSEEKTDVDDEIKIAADGFTCWYKDDINDGPRQGMVLENGWTIKKSIQEGLSAAGIGSLSDSVFENSFCDIVVNGGSARRTMPFSNTISQVLDYVATKQESSDLSFDIVMYDKDSQIMRLHFSDVSISDGSSEATLYESKKVVGSGDSVRFTIDGNGGEVDKDFIIRNPSDSLLLYDEAGNAVTATREDYTFTRWVDGAGNEVGRDAVASSVSGTTIFADWMENQITVHYDTCNDDVTDPADVSVGVTQTLGDIVNATVDPSSASDLDGYKFDGWYTSAGDDGTKVTSESSVRELAAGSDEITLYAHYVLDTSDVSVTFNGNGGTIGGQESTQASVAKQSSVTLPTPDSRVGYSFAGWQGSDGSSYDAGAEVTINSEMVFTAQWDAIEYTVMFSVDDSLGELSNGDYSDSNTYKYDDVIKLPSVNPEEGYRFEGWYAGDGDYQVNAGITVGELISALGLDPASVSTIEVEAKVVDASAPRAIVLNGNGGTIDGESESSIDRVFGANAALSETFGEIPEASRDGFAFKGWSVWKDDEETIVSSEDNVFDKLSGRDLILYAVWEEIDTEVDVMFDAGSGTCNVSAMRTSGGRLNSLPTASRKGFVFTGWYTAEGNNGEEVTASTVFTEPTTVYAHYAKATNTVKLDANGGTIDGASTKDVTLEDVFGDLPEASRDGYTFKGWSIYKNDVNTIVSADDSVEGALAGHDMILYAVWEEIDTEVDVTFDAGNGNCSTVSSHTVDGKLSSLPKATLTNYEFIGWFTGPNGSGDEVTTDTVFKSPTTVFAYYVKNACTVTFDANGGTLDGDSSYVGEVGGTIGTFTPNGLPVPSKTNAKFLGWFTAKSGGQEVDLATVVSGNMTYYAHWENVSKKLTTLKITSDKNVTMDLGASFTPKYTYGPQDATFDIYWESSDPSVISVIGDDTFAQKSAGTVTLTVKDRISGLSDSMTVTLNAPAIKVTSLNFQNSEQTVTRGNQNLDLGFTCAPLNADNKQFVWSSSDPSIVDISEDGLSYKYGGKLGDVTITLATADGSVKCNMLVHVVDPNADDNPPEQDIKYTVRFINEGVVEKTVTVDANKAVNNFYTPVREGYTFDGWYSRNGVKLTAIEHVTSDVSLYAHWIQNEPEEDTSITISFESQGAGLIPSVSIEPGEALGKQLPTPSRKGYTFLGWYLTEGKPKPGEEAVTASTKFDADTTLYAHWVETATMGKFTLTFDPGTGQVNGNSGLTTAVLKLESGKNTLNDVSSYKATKQGYTFNGWLDENGDMVYDASGKAVKGAYWDANGKYVGRDLTVYADWLKDQNVYPLYFDVRGGNEIAPVEYTEGTVVSNFPTPTYGGYEFKGWFTDSTYKTEVTSLTMDRPNTVYAKWEKIPADAKVEVYTIEFDAQDGVTDIITYKVNEGTIVEMPTPSMEGYVFDGWFTEPKDGTGNLITSVKASCDLKLYGHWHDASEDVAPVPKAMITFDYNDGNGTTRKLNVDDGITIEAMPIAARNGYRFLGWYDDPEEGTLHETYKVDGNATLYAHWEEDGSVADVDFILSFDSQGGNEIPSIGAKEGKTIASLPVPSREGYLFDGWYTDPEAGDLVTEIELHANVTLYAHWSEYSDEVWVVTLDNNDDSGVKPHSWALSVSKDFSAFTTPSREGYTFDGWYTAADGGDKVVSPYKYAGDKDVTFYAHWTKGSVETPSDTEKKLVTKLELSDHELIVTKGDALNLTYVYGPKDAENAQFVWSSSDDSVIEAVTDENGNQKLRYNGVGTVTLTIATVDGSVSDSCVVTVKEAEASEDPVLDANYKLNVTTPAGSGMTVNAKGRVTLDKLASKMGYTVASWLMDDAELASDATVSQIAGKVSAVGSELKAFDSEGNVLATVAVSKTDDIYTYDVVITASETPEEPGEPSDPEKPDTPVANLVARLSLNEHAITREKGEALDLVYTYGPKDAENAEFIWTSSDPSVIEVVTDDAGVQKLKYVGTGVTTLTISTKDGSISDSCEVTVTEKSTDPGTTDPGTTDPGTTDPGTTDPGTVDPGTTEPEKPEANVVTRLSLNEHDITREKGEALGLVYTYGPKGAENAEFVWTSSDEKVILVTTSEDGTQKLKYVGAGVTTLTISTKDGSISDSCKVTVTDKNADPGTTDPGTTDPGTTDPGTKDPDKEPEKTDPETPAAVKYTLRLELEQATMTVTLNNSHSLGDLMAKLNYTNVAGWKLNGKSISSDTTLATVAESVPNVGDSTSLTALDSNGKVLADGTLTKTGENSYTVKVNKDDDAETPSDTKPTDTTTPGSGTTDPGTGTTTPTDTSQGDEIVSYTLKVVSATGSQTSVTIKSNKTLEALATALGYNTTDSGKSDYIAKWAVKQANIAEYAIDGSYTMKSLADLVAKNGDLEIIAYKSDGTAIGAAKVEANGDNAFTVTLSKDTNMALRSADEIASGKDASVDGKGKSDSDTPGTTPSNPVENEGKSDSEAPGVQTSDSGVLATYGILGSVSAAIAAAFAILRKRLFR